MNILFYGAGALGQALGCMLARKGHNVDLLLRRRFIQSIREQGLKVQGVMGEFCVSGHEIGLLETLAETNRRYDYSIITTKTYDTESSARQISVLEERAGVVVSMQNGCGNLEILQSIFGPDKSLGARVITGFEILTPGTVNISVTADAIHIGENRGEGIPQTAVELAKSIDGAGHPCVAVENINESLFAKLLYNCALNPLGAILGVHYGVLAENDGTRQIMDSIIEETFAVIDAMGGRTPWQSAEEYKKVFYETLIPATYNHRPSMLQDLEAGKPTEVDSLAGYVSKMGRIHGTPTVTCDLLAAMVRFKESETFVK